MVVRRRRETRSAGRLARVTLKDDRGADAPYPWLHEPANVEPE